MTDNPNGTMLVAGTNYTGHALEASKLKYSFLKPYLTNINKVKTVQNINSDTIFTTLRNEIDKISSSTPFLEAEIAKGMTIAGSNGWETDELISGFQTVAEFATANGLELKESAEFIKYAADDYGLAMDEVFRAADSATYNRHNSGLGISSLKKSLSAVSERTKKAGYTFVENVASLGLFSSAGINDDKAASAYRSMVGDLLEPSAEAKSVFEKYSISINDVTGKLRPFATIIGELQVALKALPNIEEGKEALATIFNSVDSELALNLTNAMAPEKYGKHANALIESVKGSNAVTGVTREKTKSYMDSAGGVLNLVESGFEEVAITAFKGDSNIVIRMISTYYDTFTRLLTNILRAINILIAYYVAKSFLNRSLGVNSTDIEQKKGRKYGRKRGISGISDRQSSIAKKFGFVERLKSGAVSVARGVKGAGEVVSRNIVPKIAQVGGTALRSVAVPALKAVGTGIAALATPVVAKVAAVGAAVGVGGYLVYKNWENIASVANDVGNWFTGNERDENETTERNWILFSEVDADAKKLWSSVKGLVGVGEDPAHNESGAILKNGSERPQVVADSMVPFIPPIRDMSYSFSGAPISKAMGAFDTSAKRLPVNGLPSISEVSGFSNRKIEDGDTSILETAQPCNVACLKGEIVIKIDGLPSDSQVADVRCNLEDIILKVKESIDCEGLADFHRGASNSGAY